MSKTLMTPEKENWHSLGMRPGRIDEIIDIELPQKEQRLKILQRYLEDYSYDEEALLRMAETTEGFSGAYLKELAIRLTAIPFSNPLKEIEDLKETIPNLDLE